MVGKRETVSLDFNEEEVRKDFRFPVSYPISGRILDFEGNPAGPFSLRLMPEDGGELMYSFGSDVDGSFRIKVPGENYTLTVSAMTPAPGMPPEEFKVVKHVAAGTENLIIELDASVPSQKRVTVEGVVLDAVTRKPVEKPRVGYKVGGFGGSVATGEDGKFRFPCFPGEVRITASHKDYRSSSAEPFTAQGGKTYSGIVILMEKGGASLKIFVIDENGNPVEGVTVSAGEHEGKTDSSGTVCLEHINPKGGEYVFASKPAVGHAGHLLKEEEVLSGNLTLTIKAK